MNLMPGDVVLIRGKGFGSEAIEFITHSKYSHATLVIDPATLIEAQDLRTVGDAPAIGYKGVADVFRSGLSPDVLANVVQHAKEYRDQKYGYDYPLIGVEFVRYLTGLNIPYNESEHHELICSTLVATCFRKEGQDPTPGIYYPSPGDLAESHLWTYQFSY